jgi:hypothetical protein
MMQTGTVWYGSVERSGTAGDVGKGTSGHQLDPKRVELLIRRSSDVVIHTEIQRPVSWTAVDRVKDIIGTGCKADRQRLIALPLSAVKTPLNEGSVE